jgi:hypothetical protein
VNRVPAARRDEMLAERARPVPFYRELPDAAAVRQANRGTTT